MKLTTCKFTIKSNFGGKERNRKSAFIEIEYRRAIGSTGDRVLKFDCVGFITPANDDADKCLDFKL
jgi:hypothetical protein